MTDPSDAPASPARRFPTGWIGLLLAVIVLAAFSPALLNDFVEYDDDVNFLKNLQYRGLGAAQLRWMFTTVHAGHWIPVTWMTFGLDYTLWAMDPFGYHLTNLVLHAAAASLLYLVALDLIGRAGWSLPARHAGASVAALFWALHPMRAESVAWVTERRDVLSTTFFLLAVLLYLRAEDRAGVRPRLIVLSLAAFMLGIASKAMVMSLPAVLIILDVYPLRRIGFTRARRTETRSVLLAKAPFLVLGLAAAALGYYGQQANQFFTPLEHYSWSARVAIVGFAYAFYVWKTLIPIGLSPLYELPAYVGLANVQFAIAWGAVLAITVAAVLVRRRAPVVVAAWVAYVVMLAPVSGIAHAGTQIANDRYTYLPSLALALLVGTGTTALVAHHVAVRRVFVHAGVSAVMTLLAMLGALTWGQVQTWRNTETLWTYALDSEPSCAICHGNLAAWLTNHGNAGGAIREYGVALELRPDRTALHSSLGIALLNVGRVDEALVHFEKRRAAQPRDVSNLVAMSTALIRAQRYEAAERTLVDVLNVAPRHAIARANYATTLVLQGRGDDGVRECRQAVRQDADSGIPRYICARLFAYYGDVPVARAQLAALSRLDIGLAARLGRELGARSTR